MKKMKEELARDVESLFASEVDLSEDFKIKAASLFEAVVSARVANEIEELEDQIRLRCVALGVGRFYDGDGPLESFLSGSWKVGGGDFKFVTEENGTLTSIRGAISQINKDYLNQLPMLEHNRD